MYIQIFLITKTKEIIFCYNVLKS